MGSGAGRLDPPSLNLHRRSILVIRPRRLARTIGGVLAVLAIVLSIAAVLIPQWIDLPQLREQVVAQLSSYVHGTVTVQTLRLAVLPLPHAVLRGVGMSRPGTAEVKIASVAVYPELWPLLRGRLQPSTVKIVEPELSFELPTRVAEGAAGEASAADLGARLTALLASGGTALPTNDLTVTVERGQLRLTTTNTAALALTNITSRIHLHNQKADLELTGTSSLAERITLQAAVTPSHARVDVHLGSIDVATVRAAVRELANDVPVAGQVFAILRGGHVTGLTLHSEGPTLADLGNSDAFEIRGALAGAHVHIPGVDLDLQDLAGEVVVKDGALAGEHLVARLGQSRARAGTLRLGLGAAPLSLNVETIVDGDAAELVLLLKRLTTGALPAALDRVSDTQGKVTGKLTLSGSTADVTVTVDVSQLQLSTRVQGLKDRVQVAGGRLSYTTQHLVVSDLTVRAGGSKVSKLSFSSDWAASPAALAVTAADADIALAEVYPWLATSGWFANVAWAPQALAGRLQLESLQLNGPATAPAQWQFEGTGAALDVALESQLLQKWTKLRSGMSLADARLVRDASGGFSLSGTFRALDDLHGTVELLWDTDELRLKRLTLRDAASTATFSMLLKHRVLDLGFDGTLGKSTLDQLLANHPFPGRELRGKMHGRLPLDEPVSATADGRLEATEVLLPTNGPKPLRAESLVIDAQGRRFAVHAAVVGEARTRLQVAGTLAPSSQGLVADLDVTAGALDWSIVESFPAPAPETGDRTPAADAIPLIGTLRVAADSFTYDRFTWKPLHATVLLAGSATTMTVTDANLCGIAMPGKIALAADGFDVAVQPQAHGALDQMMGCLSEGKGLITGQYTLKGSATGHGRVAEISKSMQGEMTFETKGGRIYRTQVAKTLLSVLSIATGSVLNVTDMAKEGFEYEHITIDAVLRGRTLEVSKVVVNAPSAAMVGEGSVDIIDQTIDLTLLVAPLKTIDTVVKNIPLLGKAMGGTLVSIPVRISGPLSDADVTPMSPEAVGNRLRGFMERAVQLPGQIIEQMQPERK